MNPDRVIQSEVDAVLTQMETHGAPAETMADYWRFSATASYEYAHHYAPNSTEFAQAINRAYEEFRWAVECGADPKAIDRDFERIREQHLERICRRAVVESVEVLPGNIWKGLGYALAITFIVAVIFYGFWHFIPWREIWNMLSL